MRDAFRNEAFKALTKMTHYCPHGVRIETCDIQCREHSIECLDSDMAEVNPYNDAYGLSRREVIDHLSKRKDYR